MEVLNFSSQSLQGSVGLSCGGVVVVVEVVVVSVHLEASARHSSWWLQNWFIIIMLILKMLEFTCPCTFCKLQLPFLSGPDKIRVQPECNVDLRYVSIFSQRTIRKTPKLCKAISDTDLIQPIIVESDIDK